MTKTRLSTALCLVATTLAPAATATAAPREFSGSTPLQWSVRCANSEVSRLAPANTYGMPDAKWSYANFLELRALLNLDTRLAEPTPRYLAYVRATTDSFLSPDGKTIAKVNPAEYSLDDIAPGAALEYLYRLTKSDRYRNTIELLRRQLDPGKFPRVSEGAFWHKKRYPHQVWLDGLYMGSPFYAEYTATFETSPAARDAAYDDIANQFRIAAKHTRDAATGLYYHAWDESRSQDWANKQTGQSPNFWSRGIGWFAMALPDVLDFLPDATPKDKARRAELITIFKNVIDGVIKYQDPATGCWWQVTALADRKGNYLEATATAMFAYAMAKGINRGYLDRATYEPPALKAYGGLIKTLIKQNPDGTIDITNCCSGAGLSAERDGTFEYYINEPITTNDPKAAGPFILAGIEFDRLLAINETVQTLPPTPAIKLNIGASTPQSAAGTKPKKEKTAKPAAVAQTAKSADATQSRPIQNPKSKIQNPWDMVPLILARIKAPQFPDRTFSILDYGAQPAATHDSTDAIRKAIAACNAAGGGTVLVPPGEYLTGAIHLKSNVNLHISKNATLHFKTDPDAYMPVVFTRWEGVELMNFSPLIYAYEQENIAITGEGTLDGQADETHWLPMGIISKARAPGIDPATTSRARLMRQADEPIEKQDPTKRIYGKGDVLRPVFIQPYKCKNILIENVTIIRSPFWEIHPALCRNVTIRGVNIKSHGQNNDGVDPESSADVLIENVTFDTGDDCIAIKSGRNNDGRRVNVPAENIIIRNCVMKDGHGGVSIGSEITGGCRNVFIENCVMDSPNLDRAMRIKSNAVRGGLIENINMRNIQVGRVADAVLRIDYWYEEGDKGPYKPKVRNVTIENLTSQSSPRALYFKGYADNPISGVTLRNCTFNGVENEDLIQYVDGIVQENVVINRLPGSENNPTAPEKEKKKKQKPKPAK